MPVYTYRCENCGIQFDQTQKFSDPLLTRCPECGKKSLKKVYTPVGIVFKGSGFYATDHRSPSGNTSHASSKHDEPKSDEPKTSEKTEKDSAPTKTSEMAKTATGETV
ncbi:MAG TPA: zinc ribbon domain-containing protein [Anaerolineaceae bacterium]|nr:zinc ribbon domain-containing protein [Anaerolineaceae bacterium]